MMSWRVKYNVCKRVLGHQARNKKIFSSLIKETFFKFFSVKKFKLNIFVVQALETQISKVALVGFRLRVHQPLSKILFLLDHILFLKLMSREESRRKKVSFLAWPPWLLSIDTSTLSVWARESARNASSPQIDTNIYAHGLHARRNACHGRTLSSCSQY